MSQPEISIIIPVLNEASDIVSRLQYLQAMVQQQHREVEVIVVDGGSIDNTIELASRYADQVLVVEKGRSHQMNAGAKKARGKTLFFLHVDTQLPKDPFSMVGNKDKLWGFYKAKLSGSNYSFRIIEAMMNLRSRLTSVATGDQCLWVQRKHFEKLQGFADIPLMEDVEICKRLRKSSSPYIHQSVAITSSRRWEQRGVIKTVLLMWYLRALYFLGVSPSRLVKKYYA